MCKIDTQNAMMSQGFVQSLCLFLFWQFVRIYEPSAAARNSEKWDVIISWLAHKVSQSLQTHVWRCQILQQKWTWHPRKVVHLEKQRLLIDRWLQAWLLLSWCVIFFIFYFLVSTPDWALLEANDKLETLNLFTTKFLAIRQQSIFFTPLISEF